MVAITTLVAASGERLRVKAGAVCLQCETVWSTPECFSGEFLAIGRYTNVCLLTRNAVACCVNSATRWGFLMLPMAPLWRSIDTPQIVIFTYLSVAYTLHVINSSNRSHNEGRSTSRQHERQSGWAVQLLLRLCSFQPTALVRSFV